MLKRTLLLVLFLFAGRSEAADLNVVGGQLQGATSVDIDGVLYDVEFVDGQCPALFNGCNEASDFGTSSAATAVLFAEALRDQVVIDGSQGNFDSDPGLVAGCSAGEDECVFINPYGVDASNSLGVWFYNNASSADTILTGPAFTPFSFETGDPFGDGITWARWSLQATPAVPSGSWSTTLVLLALLSGAGMRAMRTTGPGRT